MELPTHIPILFSAVTIISIFIFWLATQKNKLVGIVLLVYATLQALLAYLNFYSPEPLVTVKIPLVVAPAFICIAYLLLSAQGKQFISSLDIKLLTLLHIIRIPVELILFQLFLHNAIPEAMTFEGQNFDILAGLTAPIVYYFAFIKNKIGPKGLIIWNILSLLLLINIIVTAILSLPLPIQQFGLEQPNRAILYFPFIWLPSIIVPIAFFSHSAAIQKPMAPKIIHTYL